MSVDALLNRLSGVRATGQDKWVALCPAHDDRSPSLAVRVVDGRVLMHCFGGCEVEAVLGSIGLTFSALFPERCGDHAPLRRRFDPTQVLIAIAHEAFVVALTAEDLKSVRMLSENQAHRLTLAVQRILSAMDAIGSPTADEIRRIRQRAA